MKAGEWHETVRQPELICSARGVIDAEIVYTRSQSFLFFFLHRTCVCARLHFCMRSRAPALHPVSVRIQYVCHRAHTLRFYMCDCLCACIHHHPPSPSPSASAKVSHLPAPARGRPDSPNLQSSLPPSLPHLSIHLTEGFTLLTVKFTHIHNYVFNQSHLKAGRMQPFSGNGRRSASTLRGPSGLIPAFALPAND